MSRKFFLLSCCVMCLAFSSGCESVPSEVKQEISILDYQDDNRNNDKLEIKYQTMHEIRENVKFLVGSSATKVQIIGEPVIPKCDFLPVYQVLPIVFSDSDTEAYFSKVKNKLDKETRFSVPAPEWYHSSIPMSEISGIDENGNEKMVDVSSYGWTLFADGFRAITVDKTTSLAVVSRGGVCNYWQDVTPPIYYTDLEIEKVIPVGYDKTTLSQSYKMMNGKEWSLLDAKSYAERFFNDTFSNWNGQISFQVKEIRVKKLPQGNYGYDFTLQQIYESDSQIPILPLEYLNYPRKTPAPNNVLFGKTCTMWCLEPDCVQEVSMRGVYQFQNTNEENQKLISAESALDIISSALAKEKTISVYMELGYAGVISGSEYFNITGNMNEVDVVLQNGDYKSSTAVPYWFIWEPVDQMKPRMSGNYYLVNALTGDLKIL